MSRTPPAAPPVDRDQRRRWAVVHGALLGAARRRAREGVPAAELVVSPEPETGPGPAWDRMREHRPFAPGPAPGMLVTAHYDVAREVLVSDDFGMLPPAAGPLGPLSAPSLVTLDGDAHSHHRRLLTRAFTPRVVAGWREQCVAVVDTLLDALPAAADADGTVDLVDAFARPLPLRLIAEVLGLPAHGSEIPAELPHWGDAATAGLDGGLTWERFVEMEEGVAALRGWLDEQVTAIGAHGGEGLLARLAEGGTTHDDLVVIALFLVGAGYETTMHLLAGSALQLARLPEETARLRAEPADWPSAVEELLRMCGPVTRAVRRAKADVEFQGAQVPAGTVVEVLVTAANHDPAAFPDPWTFRPGRERPHLALGRGAHHCLGAALARMEATVALPALVERFPELTPVDEPVHWSPNTLVRGRIRVPVRL